MVGNVMLTKFKNVFNFVDLIYSVIELSLGEYGNSVDVMIKLVEEQNLSYRRTIG